ncbi:MAG: ABC transporter permease [Mycobacteriales bacterium]
MTAPVLRLWLRAALRRPGRAVAAVVMAVVMALATQTSLVAADSLARLFTSDAASEWGAVDVEARSSRTSLFDDSAGRAVGEEAGPLSPRWAPRLLLAAVVLHGDRVETHGEILGLGPEDQAFPPLVAERGSVDWLRLDADQALVNDRLARRLHLGVGDPLTVVVAVPEWRERMASRDTTVRHLATTVRLSFRVAGVLADRGTADLHRTSNVVVSRDVLQRRTGLLPGKSTVLHLAARSHDKDDAKALIDRLNPTALGLGLSLRPVRAEALETAGGEGGLFRSILLALAVLVTAAAAAAVVNLLTALGLERARELAVLRAWGLTDKQTARLLVMESAAYGLFAAVVGTVLAVPLARSLAGALADHFAQLSAGRGREQVRLGLDLNPWTVASGVVVMVVVVSLAARSAARRVLAADVDRVLRGEVPGPARPDGQRRAIVVLSAGCLCLGAGLAGGPLLYLGLTLLLATGWLYRRRQHEDPGRFDRAAAVGGLLWAFVGAAVLGDFAQGVQAGFGIITVAGLLAIGCGCVLATDRLRDVMRRVRGYAPRGVPQAALLAAGASAQQRRDRSGLAMATVAAALFTVASLAVLGNAAGQPATRQGGGFDALGTSVADADVDRLRALPEAGAVVGLPSAIQPEERFRVEDDGGRRMTVPYPVRVAGLNPQFVAAQRFGLAAALPGYGRAVDALQAVLVGDDKAVLDRSSRPEGAQPGDDVVLDTPGGVRRFRLVAVLDTFLVNSVLLSDTSFRSVATARGDTMVLARAAAGTSRTTLAHALARTDRGVGLDAKTVDEARADVIAANRTFTDVFALMVVLALLVSLTSVAAGVTRSARERRHELAVLRALGATRRHIVLVLAAEPVLTTTLGATLGLGVGLLLLRVLFAVGYSDLTFLVDWPRLGLAVLAVEVLTVLGCCLAAVPAARRRLEADLADLG